MYKDIVDVNFEVFLVLDVFESFSDTTGESLTSDGSSKWDTTVLVGSIAPLEGELVSVLFIDLDLPVTRFEVD